MIKQAYACAICGRYKPEGGTFQHFEPTTREVANNITTIQKDSLVIIIKDITQCKD